MLLNTIYFSRRLLPPHRVNYTTAVVTELSSCDKTAAKSENRFCDILFYGNLSRTRDLCFATEISP